jgi:hypothetical protein
MVVSIWQRSGRAETLQPDLEIDNFKTRLKRFRCIFWRNKGSFFGVMNGHSETRSQDLSNGTNVASQLANFLSVFFFIV